jgi:hypothetical protein
MQEHNPPTDSDVRDAEVRPDAAKLSKIFKRLRTWTEQNDQEIEYGRWYVHEAKDPLEEESKIRPQRNAQKIWPHWSHGVPKKLRRSAFSPSFRLNGVQHYPRAYFETLELNWNDMRLLSQLENSSYLLPGDYEHQWSGVYRLFSPETTIDRSCGKDPTGTLYLGMAGARGRNWSTLRTRISSIVKGDHHAMQNRNKLARNRYPWNSLAVEWAYTDRERLSYKGKPFAEAIVAERWLLECYNDSFGELPPWNQRG